MLWRACRGNVFLRQAEIEDPLEDPLLGAGDEVFKSVFVIFFQGEQLKTRVKKICEGFRATLYPCPDQVTMNNCTYLKRILDKENNIWCKVILHWFGFDIFEPF